MLPACHNQYYHCGQQEVKGKKTPTTPAVTDEAMTTTLLDVGGGGGGGVGSEVCVCVWGGGGGGGGGVRLEVMREAEMVKTL